MDIEERLLKYRQESEIKQVKNSSGFFSFLQNNKNTSKSSEEEKITEKKPLEKTSIVTKRKKAQSNTYNLENDDETEIEQTEDIKTFTIKLALQILLWTILFALFIKLEFGAVYFVISLLFIIYLNTGKRKKGKISAYSVFNPNVERIQGTLTPEHIEKSLIGSF